jgi:hypothetical protein
LANVQLGARIQLKRRNYNAHEHYLQHWPQTLQSLMKRRASKKVGWLRPRFFSFDFRSFPFFIIFLHSLSFLFIPSLSFPFFIIFLHSLSFLFILSLSFSFFFIFLHSFPFFFILFYSFFHSFLFFFHSFSFFFILLHSFHIQKEKNYVSMCTQQNVSARFSLSLSTLYIHVCRYVLMEVP